MYVKQYPEIIDRLKETDKAVIAIGCSFVQGQGAIDAPILDNYPWHVNEQGMMMLQGDQDLHKKIGKIYSIPYFGDRLDFTDMEYKNSFVSVLCDKYLNREWTPINFGMRGNGNRASIKQLYSHPHLRLNEVSEKVVIYMPSGMERFDFVQSFPIDHFGFITMWPHYQNISDKPRKMLWEGYAKTIWSEYHEALEQIYLFQEIDSWCKNNNAKLIIFPGFDHRYTKEEFSRILLADLNTPTDETAATIKERLKLMIDEVPWEKFIEVDDCRTFTELLSFKSTGVIRQDKWSYWDYFQKGSPDGYFTKCCHPGAIGHDYLASKLKDMI